MRLASPRIRLLLLGLTVLVAAQVTLAIFSYWRAVHDEEDGFTFPLPGRIAAMVESLETVPASARPALLQAMTSDEVSVWIAATDELDLPNEGRAQLPRIERAFDRYIDALDEREVRAWLAPRNGEPVTAPRFERLRLWSPDPLRLAVTLSNGDWLVVESSGDHAEAFLGTPRGFWSGLLGILVATLALLTLWRGLSPLESLAGAVERFSARPVAETVAARGPHETRRIIEAVNQMQAELSGFIIERQLMFGALSHDLRTYLTRLRLRADLIEDDSARARAETDLDAMNAIIEDGLFLAKLDASQEPPPEIIDLWVLVDELRRGLDLPEEAASFRVTASARDSVAVRADGVSILRAVQNLVENARAYAGGGEIEIGVAGDRVHIDVLDRGPGIPEADRTRLMRPFERGDRARSMETPGSGLGLAIALRVAKTSGGSLSLQDRSGGGLIARLELPLANAAQD
ncbi:MAG: HAMP domain-containing protein [Hyphomonas sp.]|nr:HAMP domain-containing protein [Hyphomonas sp.]